jgi:hypothetical protein
MERPLTPIPLKFDRDASRRARLTSLYRAIACSARAAFDKAVNAAELCKRTFPNDVDALLLLGKSAVTPLRLSDLPSTVMADLLVALGQTSAGSTLLERGLQLSFKGHATISVPKFIADATSVGFVAEGQAIPVVQLLSHTPTQLTPHKLASIVVFTQEMLNASNIEAIVQDTLLRSAGLSLDTALFDSSVATPARPAGIKNGIAADAASTSPNLTDAMMADLTTLAKVGVLGGPITYIASHVRANLMRLRAPQGLENVSILGSVGVAATDLIAVATDGLASSLGTIEFDSKRSALIHEDTVPSAISTPGSPPVVAAPTRSVYQTDSVATKVRMTATWAVRDSRAVAWMTGVTW